MTVKDQAKKLAAGASVALATSGLSSCNDNGAVDPLPGPLQCNTVNAGQSLVASATRSADTVNVSVLNTMFDWRVTRVTALSGATLISAALPLTGGQPLNLALQLTTSTTTQAQFRIEATISDGQNSCSVTRTFTVTISASGVQVSAVDTDDLPLAARQRASILLARQEGRTVELLAQSPYLGPHEISWSVSAGELDVGAGAAARWTLPAEPGIYQAELVVDYGTDGLAFDVLLLEVV
jgi:hypothetical protein